MSKYLEAGWEKFSFIVTPAELEEVLADMHLLIISRHVAYGYKETPLHEYIADYNRIYSKLISGQQVTSEDVWNFVEIGIAKSLEKHAYGSLHTYRSAKYQLADFDEPCAMISHFPMYINTSIDGKSTLTISVTATQFPENTVGLTLSFPKKIQYEKDGEYLPLQRANDLGSYQDYITIRDRIKAITKPLRLMVDGKEVRPRVRISQAALNDIDKFSCLQTNNIYAIK